MGMVSYLYTTYMLFLPLHFPLVNIQAIYPLQMQHISVVYVVLRIHLIIFVYCAAKANIGSGLSLLYTMSHRVPPLNQKGCEFEINVG